MLPQLTLVVDSNILFSSVIKEGKNAELIMSDRLFLIAPEWLFREFKNNKSDLLKKTNKSEEEFWRFFAILEDRIKTVPREEFEHWLKEAKEKSTPNDFPFAALAKAFNCPVWSNDRDFKKMMESSGCIAVLNTGEVLENLGLA